jgi:hypothetical protein
MSPNRFWSPDGKASWPIDTSSHIFLGRVIHPLGRALLGDEWTGTEDYPDDGEIFPSLDLTHNEWAAQLKAIATSREQLSSAESRFFAVQDKIAALAESELLVTAWRPSKGGDPVEIPRSWWNTEKIRSRFYACKINTVNPFSDAIGGDHFAWIFVTKKSIDEQVELLGRHVAPAQAATVKAEKQCQVWLEQQFALGETADRTKPKFSEEARNKFGVGTKSFNRAWAAATASSGLERSRAGRKPKLAK